MNIPNLTIAALSDSSKIHSGFGTVVERIYQGFHDAGYKVYHYGFLDFEPDFMHKLPYDFTPVPVLDDLAHQTYGFFLRKTKPDIIFIMTDPGNLYYYAQGIANGQATQIRNGEEFIPPIVAYVPIESKPLMDIHGEGFNIVEVTGGALVVYCQTAYDTVTEQFPELNPYIVNHGLNHADFRKYSDTERKALRKLAGLDDYFMVFCGGANKGTKGFPHVIEMARILRRMGKDKGIKFYCHTNADQEAMQTGHKLRDIARYYGVADMFLWKQFRAEQNYWLGAERDKGTVKDAVALANRVPDTPEGRGVLFASYDFVSMLNCMDLCLDPSSVEGWGLIPGEAMKCGLPTIQVNDYGTRREIYGDGAYLIEPIPERCWQTWSTGGRLVGIDPLPFAEAILKFKEDRELREKYSELAIECAAKYKWEDSQAQFNEIILEVFERTSLK